MSGLRTGDHEEHGRYDVEKECASQSGSAGPTTIVRSKLEVEIEVGMVKGKCTR